MTRTVFDNHGLAHAWASGNVPEGKSGNGNFWFSGRALYSYGVHYLLAYDLGARGDWRPAQGTRRVQGEGPALGAGPLAGVVLFNADSSSMTTNGKHKPAARGAIRHKETVQIPNLTALRDALERLDLDSDPYGNNALAVQSWARSTVTDSKGANRYTGLAYPDLTRGLFELFGIKGAAAFLKDLEARDRKERKERAARDHAAQVERVKSWAAFTPLEMRAHALGVLGTWGGEGKLRDLARDLARSLKTARAQGLGVRVESKLRDHKRTVAAILARLEGIEARRATRRAVVSWIKRLRLALEETPADLDPAAALARLRYYLEAAAGHLVNSESHRAADPAQEVRELRVLAVNRSALALHNSPAPLGPRLRARLVALEAATAAETRGIVGAREGRARAKAEAREAERLEKERETRESWLEGKPGVRWHGRDALGGAYLRAVRVTRDESGMITGGDLETSQGASVPLTHALRVFRFLKHCKETGRAWARNGKTLRVGFYHVDSVDPDGSFKAGCHLIRWQQVEALAARLGVLDLAAADVTEPAQGAA